MNSADHNDCDTQRRAATPFSINLEEAGLLFREAGLPRNLRSLQRYCAGGRLDCIKEETINGLQYFVDPESVTQAIVQLAQLHGISEETHHGASGPDRPGSSRGVGSPFPRIDAVGRSPSKPDDVDPLTEPVSNHDIDRQVTTPSDQVVPERLASASDDTVRPSPAMSDKVAPEFSGGGKRPGATDRDSVSMEKTASGQVAGSAANGFAQEFIDLLKSENSFLRQQVSVKDEQIADLLERDRESNILVQGLQKLLQPLLRGPGGSQHSPEPEEFDHRHP